MKVVLIYPLYAACIISLPLLFEASFNFMALAVATTLLCCTYELLNVQRRGVD